MQEHHDHADTDEHAQRDHAVGSDGLGEDIRGKRDHQGEPEIHHAYNCRQCPGKRIALFDQLQVFRVFQYLAGDQFRHDVLPFLMFSEFPGGSAAIADGLLPILSISDLLKLLTLIDVLMTFGGIFWNRRNEVYINLAASLQE